MSRAAASLPAGSIADDLADAADTAASGSGSSANFTAVVAACRAAIAGSSPGVGTDRLAGVISSALGGLDGVGVETVVPVTAVVVDEVVQSFSAGERGLLAPIGQNIGAAMLGDEPTTLASSAVGIRTYEMVMGVKKKPIAVQIIAAHDITSGAFSPLQYAVGCVAGATVAAANVVAATFSGADTPAFSLVADAKNRQFVVSDLIPFSAVERTDGFEGYGVAVRTLIPASDASKFTYFTCGRNKTVSVVDAGERLVGFREQSGNRLTSGFTVTAFDASNVLAVGLLGVILYYEDSASLLSLAGGDSNSVGQFTDTGYGCWQRKVAELIAPTVQIDHMNFAYGGGQRAFTFPIFMAQLELYRPAVAYWVMHSPNDTISDADIADEKAKVAQFINRAKVLGVVPVVSTPLPRSNRNGAELTGMLAEQAWVNSVVPALGGVAIDAMAVLGSAVDNTVFASGYGAADGVGVIHASEAGHAALAAVAYEALMATGRFGS
jgi:hypothetical protein